MKESKEILYRRGRITALATALRENMLPKTYCLRAIKEHKKEIQKLQKRVSK